MRLGCCLDFQSVDGNCKPCVGRHGPNCSLPCKIGFFGFGCRQLCNCSDRQGCDRHTGCFDIAVDKRTKSYSGEILGAVGVLFGIICLSVAGALTRRFKLHYEKKYTTNRNNVRDEMTSDEAQSIQGQYLTPISLKDKTMKSSSSPVKKQRRTNQDETTDDTAQESGYTEIPDYQQLKESRTRVQHQYAKLRDS
ncbi:uncharacterized protein LOC134269079 [Saccostrea cucullata]|uniref:uncharacterized protein LOC134269079 n=1 Tax=Saccostrea cuccullata TaxID=36930 RepID=UPI002ED25FE9